MAKARMDASARVAPRKPRPLAREEQVAALLDWRKQISDHIAYALLVYTGLQIFITIAALHSRGNSLLPSLALVLLVACIIPACRHMERRWTKLSDAEAGNPALAPAFHRDRALVWGAAIGLPFIVTGAFRLMVVMLG